MIKTPVRRILRQKIGPREALIDAVVRLAARDGIENLSVRAIVAEAEGVSTDTQLYRLFGSKEKLLSEAFLWTDKQLVYEVERRSQVLWETRLPFESRMRFLWDGMWHWLTERHGQECLFLARYCCCSLCGNDTWKEHTAAWYPLAEKWQVIFPTADTVRLAAIFFSGILMAAFPVCRGLAPNDGTASENGFRMLSGVFNFWADETAGTIPPIYFIEKPMAAEAHPDL